MSGYNGSQNSRRVSCIFNFLPLNGFADGDFLKVTPDGETYTTQIGGRGAYVASRSEMQGAKIEMSLWQTSAASIRIVEEAIRRQKLLGLDETTLVPIEVRNFDTGEHYICTQCWIEQEPEGSFSAQAKARNYVFRCAEFEKKPL